MSSKKKGLVALATGVSDMWKHLRPVGKRLFWKRHRQAEKKPGVRGY